MADPVPTVELSNFYNNSCSSYGLLAAYKGEFKVNHCIFSGNTEEFGLSGNSQSGTSRFIVTNCVFSGKLPSGTIYKSTVNNTVNMQTASFAYLYYATTLCPNLPSPPPTLPQPTSSQTNEASPTSHFSDSATVAGTELNILSRAIEESDEQGLSLDFLASAVICDTNFNIVSQAAEQSLEHAFSANFAESALVSGPSLNLGSPTVEQSSEPTLHVTSETTGSVDDSGFTVSESGIAIVSGSEMGGGGDSSSVSRSVTPDPNPNPDPSNTEPHQTDTISSPSPSVSSGPASSLAGNTTLTLVGGIVTAILVVVLAILFLVWRFYGSGPSVSDDDSEEIVISQSLEFSLGHSGWETECYGAETDNPVAPTIDAFSDVMDEITLRDETT
jgi:hypothetical protein